MKIDLCWSSPSFSSMAQVDLGKFSLVDFHFGPPIYKSEKPYQGSRF